MRFLITGASRGLGEAFARHLPESGDTVYLISRSRPSALEESGGIDYRWIAADLSEAFAAQTISGQISGPLDVLLHNAGIWESEAFTERYDFEGGTEEDLQRIIQVNLTAPMQITRTLLPALRQSQNPKIILIGSVNGLENAGFPEVAYGASKWGLRGMAHTLREFLRPSQIGVTVINPGSIGERVRDSAGNWVAGIPMEDVIRLVRCVIETSRRSVIKEIDMPAMADTQV